MHRSGPSEPIAVVPAAGLGTRLASGPYRGILPKPMVPIAGSPLIRYAIRTAARLGARTVYVVLSPSDSLTGVYVQGLSIPRLRLKLAFQDRPSGLADAVSVVADNCSKWFYVVLGDDVTIATNLSGLSRPIQMGSADAVQATVRDPNPLNIQAACGITFDKDRVVTSIEEKPQTSGFRYRGIGVYAFSQDLFKPAPLSRRDRRPTLEGILESLTSVRRFYAHPIRGLNFNVNYEVDRERAEKHLVLHRLQF